MTRAQMKQAAKDQLRGNWGWAICLTIFAWLVNAVIMDLNRWIWTGKDFTYTILRFNKENLIQGYKPGYNLSEIIVSLITGLILWGVAYTILDFVETGKMETWYSGIFSAYSNGRFKNSLFTLFMTNLFVSLWTILFIIPGFIKGYSYAMTPYILKDKFSAGQTDIGATEAITESRQLMNGHKMDLFVLDLSFIGWGLLGLITLGIGFIWITPYYRQTKANFYRSLVANN
ncbi:MAG: DUF975 family protein [Lactobacillus sp.]|nr:DUF975 family protein [Lactobacillus sp.]